MLLWKLKNNSFKANDDESLTMQLVSHCLHMDVLWLDCVQTSLNVNWINWCSASVIKNKFDINNLKKEIYVYVVWEIV